MYTTVKGKIMKIKLPAKLLSDAVGYAISAVESRHTLPILSQVLFEVTESSLSLTGTDLELTATVNIKAAADNNTSIELANDGPKVEFTLPAAKLKKLLAEAPADALVTIKSGGLKTNANTYLMSFSGINSKYTLHSVNPSDFPYIDINDFEGSIFSVDSVKFNEALLSVASSMAQHDVRYYLCGVNMELEDGELFVTGTNGHRLARNSIGYTNIKDIKDRVSCILPRKAVVNLPNLLKNQTGTIECSISSNHFYTKVMVSDTVERVFVSKLVDGRYPDINRVIPKISEQTIVLDRKEFVSACKRAYVVVSEEKQRGMKLDFNGDTLAVETSNNSKEHAREEVAIENASPLEIGVDGQYLLDTVNNFKADKIQVCLNGGNDAILLVSGDENEKLIAVVMPMRI
jgi:DNA polymerase-3 subunit beta